MTDPVKLEKVDPVIQQVVDYIKIVLAQAESGDITSVAMAYTLRDGSPGWGWSTPGYKATLAGAVAIMGHKLMDGANN